MVSALWNFTFHGKLTTFLWFCVCFYSLNYIYLLVSGSFPYNRFLSYYREIQLICVWFDFNNGRQAFCFIHLSTSCTIKGRGVRLGNRWRLESSLRPSQGLWPWVNLFSPHLTWCLAQSRGSVSISKRKEGSQIILKDNHLIKVFSPALLFHRK